jgi:hypothetical protein
MDHVQRAISKLKVTDMEGKELKELHDWFLSLSDKG